MSVMQTLEFPALASEFLILPAIKTQLINHNKLIFKRTIRNLIRHKNWNLNDTWKPIM